MSNGATETLLAALSRRSAVLSEPGAWRVWTPREDPAPSAHPLGETCRLVGGETPRLTVGAKWQPRICLRNVSDLISDDNEITYLIARLTVVEEKETTEMAWRDTAET